MFYDIYVGLCKSLNKKPSTVAAELHINKSNVSNWKNNGYTPRGEALQRIADYFGVTTDYLLTGEQKEKPSAENGEELQIPYYDDLSEENKAKAREYIEMLLKLQEST